MPFEGVPLQGVGYFRHYIYWSGNGQDFPNLVRNSCINELGAGNGICNQKLVKLCI